MFRRSSFVFRILAALVLVAILLGAGALVYRLGFSQGLAQSAALSGGEAPRFTPGFPYAPGFYRMHFGFFPGFHLFGLCLIGLLFLFIFGAFFRGPWFWGWRWGPHHYASGPRGSQPWGGPPWAGESQTEGQSGQGPSAPAEPAPKEDQG